jgi:hypothetical protein
MFIRTFPVLLKLLTTGNSLLFCRGIRVEASRLLVQIEKLSFTDNHLKLQAIAGVEFIGLPFSVFLSISPNIVIYSYSKYVVFTIGMAF